MVTPLWAAPSLMDLDSWQLPDEQTETKPVKTVQKAAAPKSTTANEGKALAIELSGSGDYTVKSSAQSSSEIAVFKSSAKQLLNRLKGQSRFHVLFNATTQAATDKIITATDGTEYAFVLFGNEKQNYRIFLFKNGIEQPLVDVAENTDGKLNMYRKYKINLDFTEEEIQKNYSAVTPQNWLNQTKTDLYHVYQVEDVCFLFQKGKLIKIFPSQMEMREYNSQLGIMPENSFDEQELPKREDPPALLSEPTIPATTSKKSTPKKRLFSRIVSSSGAPRKSTKRPSTKTERPTATATKKADTSSANSAAKRATRKKPMQR